MPPPSNPETRQPQGQAQAGTKTVPSFPGLTEDKLLKWAQTAKPIAALQSNKADKAENEEVDPLVAGSGYFQASPLAELREDKDAPRESKQEQPAEEKVPEKAAPLRVKYVDPPPQKPFNEAENKLPPPVDDTFDGKKILKELNNLIQLPGATARQAEELQYQGKMIREAIARKTDHKPLFAGLITTLAEMKANNAARGQAEARLNNLPIPGGASPEQVVALEEERGRIRARLNDGENVQADLTHLAKRVAEIQAVNARRKELETRLAGIPDPKGARPDQLAAVARERCHLQDMIRDGFNPEAGLAALRLQVVEIEAVNAGRKEYESRLAGIADPPGASPEQLALCNKLRETIRKMIEQGTDPRPVLDGLEERVKDIEVVNAHRKDHLDRLAGILAFPGATPEQLTRVKDMRGSIQSLIQSGTDPTAALDALEKTIGEMKANNLRRQEFEKELEACVLTGNATREQRVEIEKQREAIRALIREGVDPSTPLNNLSVYLLRLEKVNEQREEHEQALARLVDPPGGTASQLAVLNALRDDIRSKLALGYDPQFALEELDNRIKEFERVNGNRPAYEADLARLADPPGAVPEKLARLDQLRCEIRLMIEEGIDPSQNLELLGQEVTSESKHEEKQVGQAGTESKHGSKEKTQPPPPDGGPVPKGPATAPSSAARESKEALGENEVKIARETVPPAQAHPLPTDFEDGELGIQSPVAVDVPAAAQPSDAPPVTPTPLPVDFGEDAPVVPPARPAAEVKEEKHPKPTGPGAQKAPPGPKKTPLEAILEGSNALAPDPEAGPVRDRIQKAVTQLTERNEAKRDLPPKYEALVIKPTENFLKAVNRKKEKVDAQFITDNITEGLNRIKALEGNKKQFPAMEKEILEYQLVIQDILVMLRQMRKSTWKALDKVTTLVGQDPATAVGVVRDMGSLLQKGNADRKNLIASLEPNQARVLALGLKGLPADSRERQDIEAEVEGRDPALYNQLKQCLNEYEVASPALPPTPPVPAAPSVRIPEDTSLEAILKNPQYSAVLEKYMAEEQNREQYLFLKEDVTNINLARAQFLYLTYIRMGAPLQANIPATMRIEIEDALAWPDGTLRPNALLAPNALDVARKGLEKAHKETMALVRADALRRFFTEQNKKGPK